MSESIETAKKSNHQANIVRIEEIIPHPDPETTNLALIVIGGYQVVVGKNQFKVGDLGVYIQPDSVVPVTAPFAFLFPNGGNTTDSEVVPTKYRRITVRKFRGQWSEGLLLPISDFPDMLFNGSLIDPFMEGSDVSDFLGITHYDPDTEVASTTGAPVRVPKKKFRFPRSFKGWLRFLWHFLVSPRAATRDVPFVIPTYDVEAFKNYKGVFLPTDYVVVTEKIHGSNARYIYLDGEIYVGSKNEWKAAGGGDVWNQALKNNPKIADWLIEHPGYTLYGEVTPTQKVKGQSFDYGSKEAQFFAFDVLTPDKTWLHYVDAEMLLIGSGIKEVPLLYRGYFDEEKVAALVSGDSTVSGAKHIREGIVIKKTVSERRPRGLHRAQLKIVSNDFLAKDSK